MTDQIDQTRCPLCQTMNHCGVNATSPCWCSVAVIPQALLQQIPAPLQGKACICQACIDSFNQKANTEAKK